MEPREIYWIYKLFCNLFIHYSKDMALSMADNEIARRYTSSAAYLKRYLVQTFAIYGFTDVLASKSFDDKTGTFLVKDPEYTWINRERYPKIGELADDAKHLFNASQRCHWDTYKMAITVADFVEETLLDLKKYNYQMSSDIKRKVDIVLSNSDLALKCISGEYGNVISIEDGKYTNIDMEMRKRRRFLWDFVSDVFKFFHRYFKNINDEFLFYQIWDTACFDVRCTDKNSFENSLKENYDLFKIPRSFFPYTRIKYTSEESLQRKKETPLTKPQTVTPKPKKEVSKQIPKVSKPEPKKEVIKEESKKIITQKKEIIIDTPKADEFRDSAHVLEISKFTKLGYGYRIDKVNNLARKIIIDDSVIEISSLAFKECFKLEEVVLSSSIKVLKFGLFSNLPNLVKVSFVEGLEKIENNVFENVPLQGEINLPDSLREIGRRAFYTKPTGSLSISVSNNSIDVDDTSYSFHPLINLQIRGYVKKAPVIKKEYSDVSSSAFAFETEINSYVATAVDLCQAHESLIISNSIKKIGFRKESRNGIDTNKVKKFFIGSHVTTLFENTFVMFKELEELEFAEDSIIYELPNYMIGDCNITHIRIPDSVEHISRYCFSLCKSLRCINVSRNTRTSFLDLPEGCEIEVRD